MLNLSLAEQVNILNLRDREENSFRKIAKKADVATSTLHDNMGKIRVNVAKAFAARESNPRQSLVRVILVLAMDGKSSTRGISQCILRIWGTIVSHQTVLKVLGIAAETAKEQNQKITLENVISAIFDETFQKKVPLLVFADPFSGIILAQNLSNRTGETWSLFLTSLKALGLNPKSITSDGGSGLLAGLANIFSKVPLIRDLFHVLQKIRKALKPMERKCYDFLRQEMSLLKKKKNTEAKEMNRQFDAAATIFDSVASLFESFKNAAYLENSEQKNSYIDADTLEKLIKKIVEKIELFQEKIGTHIAIQAVKTYLKNGSNEIVEYKRLIEKSVTEHFGRKNKDKILSFFCPLIEYINQYLRSYESKSRRDFWAKKIVDLKHNLPDWEQSQIDNAINVVWSIGTSAVKSNSYIESVNGVIRTHLQTYERIPTWFPELFTYYWNHRKFDRGMRAGAAPIELLTGLKEDGDWVSELVNQFPLEKLRSGLPMYPQGLAA